MFRALFKPTAELSRLIDEEQARVLPSGPHLRRPRPAGPLSLCHASRLAGVGSLPRLHHSLVVTEETDPPYFLGRQGQQTTRGYTSGCTRG